MPHSLLSRTAWGGGWGLIPALWVGISVGFGVGWGDIQAFLRDHASFLRYQSNPKTAENIPSSHSQRSPHTPKHGLPGHLVQTHLPQLPGHPVAQAPPTTAWADSTTPPQKKGPRQGRREKRRVLGPSTERTTTFLGLKGSAHPSWLGKQGLICQHGSKVPSFPHVLGKAVPIFPKTGNAEGD